VLLKSLVFGLEVEVSIHQSLVRVVHSFEISVFAALIYLMTVELSFKTLKRSSQLVSFVILVTILLELCLLVFDKTSIYLFKFVDLEIEAVDHAL
jgi:hypothetical protein